MPRVLILTATLGNGGAERQLALLARHLPADWQPWVWSLGRGPYEQVLRDAGVPLSVTPRWRRFDPTPALPIWRHILAWRPDVIYAWDWMGGLAALPLAKALGIPLVGGIRSAQPVRRRRIFLLTMGRMDRVIANSQIALKNWRVSARKGRVIQNGLDPERLPLCWPAPSKAAAPMRVVMVARMVYPKDYSTLFEAARRLVSRDGAAQWHFTVIGPGPERERYRAEVQALIDGGCLSFPEPSLEVLPLVRLAHVGVLLTAAGIGEGMSNSLMEYMACGLPVVCSDSGGNREFIRSGEHGFIIPPGDVQGLCERLTWLRDHPAEARQMGWDARRFATSRFTIDATVNATIAVFRELLR